jgi:hypothetical protein
MFNAKYISEVLTRNCGELFCPRMFLMTPDGILLSYSTPADIKQLRDQAALVSMAWKNHDLMKDSAQKQPSVQSDIEDKDARPRPLTTMTIQTTHVNILVRAFQPQMLLVIVCGLPDSVRQLFRITAEYMGDPRFPPEAYPPESAKAQATEDSNGNVGGESDSELYDSSIPEPGPYPTNPSDTEKDMFLGVLHCQRRKLEVMAEGLLKECGLEDFVMPEGMPL